MSVIAHKIESTIPEIPGRIIRIYLPPRYEDSQDVLYPVLYLHDGQNVFSPGGEFGCWLAEQTADDLIERKKIPPLIMVAIDNDGFNRRREYVPPGDHYKDYPSGNADLYAQFMVENVIPYAQHHFRIRTGPENTAIAGSSLGGVVSIFMAMETDAFGIACSMSSAICWAPGFINQLRLKKKKSLRIYHDIGTGEQAGMAPDNYWEKPHELHQVLLRIGYQPETELKFVIEQNGQHHESAWARRLPDMLVWMYGTSQCGRE